MLFYVNSNLIQKKISYQEFFKNPNLIKMKSFGLFIKISLKKKNQKFLSLHKDSSFFKKSPNLIKIQ